MARRVRKTLLKASVGIAFTAWAFTACCLDSEHLAPILTINMLSMAWLLLMAIANKED